MSKKEIDKRQLIRRPWLTSYKGAKTRCENPNNPRYHRYGGRGIKFKLTQEKCAYLWKRDKAWSLYEPSIDRIANNGDYTLSNCHFIEMPINSGKDKKKPVLQYDLEGNFIKEWSSILEASKSLNIDNSNIGKVRMGKINSAGGYIWRIKNEY
ncbi:hypothetical protein LCGC14_1783660 [marine sediment metagenome]|uniref:Nuclease-associated modular DNA-binding 1 domain-containing protein n=1 Tax=marine sediment metagenome TaxID=412755 RepID=A0A0F9HH73_9ZZZZ